MSILNCLRRKKLLLFLILLLSILYFFYYTVVIGCPCGATVRYYDTKDCEYKTVTLTEQQMDTLIHLMRKARPTLFFMVDVCGMNNEPVLITLCYENGDIKEYSLWRANTILYSGTGEDLTMSCMYGDMFHFGGSLGFDSEIEMFIKQLNK